MVKRKDGGGIRRSILGETLCMHQSEQPHAYNSLFMISLSV